MTLVLPFLLLALQNVISSPRFILNRALTQRAGHAAADASGVDIHRNELALVFLVTHQYTILYT